MDRLKQKFVANQCSALILYILELPVIDVKDITERYDVVTRETGLKYVHNNTSHLDLTTLELFSNFTTEFQAYQIIAEAIQDILAGNQVVVCRMPDGSITFNVVKSVLSIEEASFKSQSSSEISYLSLNDDRQECFVGGDDCTVIITKLFYQYTHYEK